MALRQSYALVQRVVLVGFEKGGFDENILRGFVVLEQRRLSFKIKAHALRRVPKFKHTNGVSKP